MTTQSFQIQRINRKFCLLVAGLFAVLAQSALAQPNLVTTTADSGPGSLRDALTWANSNPGLDFIAFAIPGIGPFTIQLLSPLPDITDPVEIDGYTQPGAMPNSLSVGDDAQMMIGIDGSLISSLANGLVVANGGEGSAIRGLAISGFFNGAGILLASSSNRVQGCFLGTDLAGLNPLPNTNGIRVLNAGYNQIGGTDPASRNVISGNQTAGIDVEGAGAVETIVQGNDIGTDVSGTNALGNGGPGILIGPQGIPGPGARNTHLGGFDPMATNQATANVIAFNSGSGVLVWDDLGPHSRTDGNEILGNSIFANGGLGIDLTRLFDGVYGDGPTANDALDPDFGPNEFQNFPGLTFACSFGGVVLVRGSLNSAPSQTYHIELFANSSVGPFGFAQGERMVASADVITDAKGNATFSMSVVPTPGMPYYTATATDMQGNTSEFSRGAGLINCAGAPPCCDRPRLTLESAGAEVICRWSGSGFVVQSADDLAGPWANVTIGTTLGGTDFEAHLPILGSQQFFRLCDIPMCPDAFAATELIRTNLMLPGETNGLPTPEPTLTWFDASRLLGRTAPPQLAWTFHFDGDRPLDVIVSADGSRVLDVVLNGPETKFTHLTTPRFQLDDVTGVPRFVSFNPPLVLPEAATADAVSIANAFFTTFPWMFGTGNPAKQLQVDRVVSDLTGGKHVVFKQLYAGMLVWGCELRVHLDSHWGITSISGRYYRDPDVELTPSIGQSEAFTYASNDWAQATGGTLDPGETIQQQGLVVLPARLIDPTAQNDIAWWFTFPDADRLISGTTGTNITSFSRYKYFRAVFESDNSSASFPKVSVETQIVDGVLQVPQDQLDPDATSADEAMVSIESFWLLNFGWNAWNGLGGNMAAVLNVSFDDPRTPQTEGPSAGIGWIKALGPATFFSPGFAANDAHDLVAHEFTHLVAIDRLGLVYAFESGALDESFSDVFGKLIFPTPTPWVIGISLPSSERRDLEHPGIDNYANLVSLPNTPVGDFGGVHTNSGIGSLAAVLIAKGDGSPAHNGIGRPQLARIWWDILTTRLSPMSTYFDLVLAAAQVTQGFASSGVEGASMVPDPDMPDSSLPTRPITQADLHEVIWAFNQVGLDLRLQSGWFNVPGSATTDSVWFRGTPTDCPGQLVKDVIVRVFHRPQPGDKGSTLTKDGTGFLGEMRVSAGEISKSFGPVTVTITEHHVGTENREVHLHVTTDNFSDVEADVQEVLDGTCPSPPPVPTFTPAVVHWFDFFLGRKYDDVIYSCTSNGMLPAGCTFEDVQIELLDKHGQSLSPPVIMGWQDGPAVYGGTGAEISAPPLGFHGQDLTVLVHSWHEPGQAVRYRLIYWIAGDNCGLPAFRFCDGGDIYDPFVGTIEDP